MDFSSSADLLVRSLAEECFLYLMWITNFVVDVKLGELSFKVFIDVRFCVQI